MAQKLGFHVFTEARMMTGERLAFLNPCPGIKRHTADKGRATAVSVVILPPAGDSAEYTLTLLQGIINSGCSFPHSDHKTKTAT